MMKSIWQTISNSSSKSWAFKTLAWVLIGAALLSVGCSGKDKSAVAASGGMIGTGGTSVTDTESGGVAATGGLTAGGGTNPDGDASAGGTSSTGDAGSHPYTIYSIGDSTMATYDNAGYPLGTATERRGWCQMFPQFITGTNVTFVNYGLPGRSSRDFYNDATHNYWSTIKAALKPGDYVFIQFAHNDEVYNGLSTEEATVAGLTLSENSGTFGRGNEALGTYHDYLVKYIEETRALGANPILVGPVVRLGSFPISATNCHNLT